MQGRKILLGVTGGIAAYKAADLCRRMVKAGADVRVVMSEAACEFITPLTMETLSGKPVPVKMFGRTAGALEHIDLPNDAELLVVAPATADYLARCACGRASDLISAVTLAFTGPVIAAPAMNSNMWANPATRRNVAILVGEHGWRIVQPGHGELACGTVGAGRMAEPEEILGAVAAALRRDLDGKRVVVAAGPTEEALDPVRFISNRSSGRMGYAIASAAGRRGATVTLVTGPTELEPPRGATVIRVCTALEMERAMNDAAAGADAIVMAAAVADFRPARPSERKIKKSLDTAPTIELVLNPDILAGLGARFKGSARPVLVGFALETEALVDASRTKLMAKRCHLIVGNLAADALGGKDNTAVLVDDAGFERSTGRLSKIELAEEILDWIAARLGIEP
ncbi:MAG: bifunctional phosphopantothenoylcysteine decarboxylase/phosphopantothenate--cysteine ligase CoaBC [Proteobacteria bacterium]|jgi:phosphopantothenoylcysteine decarboxylase/phosphopantothenate--cysteine ligase|nr:bifunctional phosphopantothenoylcysteine decarboxylase/phosphopantothenate--cysteine ligase CoaBC [Pseudomonadota bacterium]